MLRRNKAFLLAVLLLLTAPFPARAEKYVTVGAGAVDCAEYAKTYQKEPQIIDLIVKQWIEGYISALNSVRGAVTKGSFKDLAPLLDDGLVMQKVNRYCVDHPINNLQDAALEILNQLPEHMQKYQHD